MRRSRFLAPVAAGALLATGGAAFLAVNAQPASGQGVSSEIIDGYNITNIHYTVAPDNGGGSGYSPTGGGSGDHSSDLNVTAVSFTATSRGNGEAAATNGFVKIDTDSNSPFVMGSGSQHNNQLGQWLSCTPDTSPDFHNGGGGGGGDHQPYVTNFTCHFNPGLPVSGNGQSQVGWLQHLSIEVNQ